MWYGVLMKDMRLRYGKSIDIRIGLFIVSTDHKTLI